MPDPKPQRPRRRWLRRLLVALSLALIGAGIVALVAVRNLEWIAKWSIHRVFPGVRAELGSLRVVSATRLEVRKLELKSSKTGESLLTLAGGSAVFRFGDVWRLRLEEVRLQQPDLVVSPDLGDALGATSAQTQTSGSASGGVGWGIDRFVVSDGRLRVTRFGEASPTVDLRFTADFKDFGVGGDAAEVVHSVQLENISAEDAVGRRFLEVGGVGVSFTTGELFSGNRVRSARVGRGELTVTPELLAYLLPGQPKAATASSEPEARDGGWSIGSLALDGMRVAIENAPGFLGRVEFHIAAKMGNLGASPAPADSLQKVTITNVRVFTDREPKTALMLADGAEVAFSMAGLAARRVESVELSNPTVDFSPAILEPPASAANPAASTAATSHAAPDGGWLIGRATCKYGLLRLRGLRDGNLDLVTRFAFDLHNLGTQGEAANAVQEIGIWNAQGSSGRSKAFISVDYAQVRFTPAGLLDLQRVEAVKIIGGRLLVGDAFQTLLGGGTDPQVPASAPGAPPAAGGWSIVALDISGVRLRLEDKREGVPNVRMTLNTSLRDVAASGVSSQLFDQVQTVELANIDLVSPLNRDAKIFTLRSVFVRFTLRDLAQKHLKEVVIRFPIIYLSRDLFVYMERTAPQEPAGGAAEGNAKAGDAAAWSADVVDVRYGKLVVGSGGRRDVGVPIEFETTLNDVALDDLARLRVQAALRVPKQSREFPDYKLAVEDVVGDLRFAYPPEKGEKNLVQKLEIRKIRWRQFESEQSWIAVTFDAKGINGQFGGESYRGYVNGGFSFNFLEDSPWQGWVSGTDVDMRELTDVMSPQNFSLTGPIDFEIQIDAFRKEIERVFGTFGIKKAGRMRIGKLDDLLANIPDTWTAIKQSSTRIALETLRDFDYTTAKGNLWFVESQGVLSLSLTGPAGSRNFDVILHDDQETQNLWQQGTLGIR